MQVDTNIQNKLTPTEKEVFSIIREVVDKYTPTTEVFAVGGWTRDKLLEIPSNDIDVMVSNVSGEDFARMVTQHMGVKNPHIIRENPEKSKHITTAKAYLPLSTGEEQEIDFAQARAEVYHEDSRIPDLKPATPQEDAYRRDLTINSIFYDIMKNEVVDFTGKGIKDLITMTIRTPENPLKTYRDDPLRIFRTVRFAAKYNGKIDAETMAAMQDPALRDEIKKKVSSQRVREEIMKMFKNPNAPYAMELMKDAGLWDDIIAEALKGTKYEGKMAPLEMEQQNVHHELTLWDHTMQTLKNVLDRYEGAEDEKRIVVILSALVHDLGKLFYEVHAPSKSHPGSVSYHGHEKESAEIAEHILRYLDMASYAKQVSDMARYHMQPHRFTERGVGSPKSMRKFIRQMGEHSLNWLDVFNLAVADAYSKNVDVEPETISKYQALEKNLQDALMSMEAVKDDLKVKPILDGDDIMQLLNVKPGPWMKDVTEFVKDLMDENPNITKEEAANMVRNQFQDLDTSTNKTAAKKDGMSDTCPMHLLKKKKEQLSDLMKDGKLFEVFSTLQQLKEEYGNDERVTRLCAVYTLWLLLKKDETRNDEMIQYIFDKAEDNFFDSVLCAYAFAILVLLKTATDRDIIKEIGNRVLKMSPGTLRSVLDLLPKEVYHKDLKEDFKNKLLS